MQQTVTIEIQDAVAIVTIDRPHARNAVDRETALALADAFRALDADPALSVAVLTGVGGTFCAGADLKAVAEDHGVGGQECPPYSSAEKVGRTFLSANRPRGNRLSDTGDGPMGPTRMLLSKPVIAAIEGYAVAGGLELALWCDLRVAARDAVFGVFCRRFGVPLVDGGTVRLPRLIGHSHALDMILTGRSVSGDEALAMGLANRIVERGQALKAAVELARDLAALPQVCMRSDRMSSYAQWPLTLEDAMRNEFRRGLEVIASGETGAGAQRFSSGQGRHGDSV